MARACCSSSSASPASARGSARTTRATSPICSLSRCCSSSSSLAWRSSCAPTSPSSFAFTSGRGSVLFIYPSPAPPPGGARPAASSFSKCTTAAFFSRERSRPRAPRTLRAPAPVVVDPNVRTCSASSRRTSAGMSGSWFANLATSAISDLSCRSSAMSSSWWRASCAAVSSARASRSLRGVMPSGSPVSPAPSTAARARLISSSSSDSRRSSPTSSSIPSKLVLPAVMDIGGNRPPLAPRMGRCCALLDASSSRSLGLMLISETSPKPPRPDARGRPRAHLGGVTPGG
mmetsp:Transcript_48116/g.154196  ORF Transcript_48116/g.154196 Transcript_48116/m.154196 type:complete len:289 (+) Transcript_48116:414-1280(+)